MSAPLSLLDETIIVAGIVRKFESGPVQAVRHPHILLILRGHLAALEARLMHPANTGKGAGR